tara:strand:+ start:45255 stop:45848 length:594 start_codon:yes stop_codon:yes gene_type:complete
VIVIGIAGGIASGKSTASEIFKRFGAHVIDADLIGHELLKSDKIRDKIVRIFGESVLTQTGDIDRRILGDRIFTDEEARLSLNKLVRPAIRQEIRQKINLKRKENKETVIVVDAALLVDSGPTDLVNCVILVTATTTIRIKRIILRNKISENEAKQRINAQVDDKKQAKWADYILENDGTQQELIKKATELWEAIVY